MAMTGTRDHDTAGRGSSGRGRGDFASSPRGRGGRGGRGRGGRGGAGSGSSSSRNDDGDGGGGDAKTPGRAPSGGRGGRNGGRRRRFSARCGSAGRGQASSVGVGGAGAKNASGGDDAEGIVQKMEDEVRIFFYYYKKSFLIRIFMLMGRLLLETRDVWSLRFIFYSNGLILSWKSCEYRLEQTFIQNAYHTPKQSLFFMFCPLGLLFFSWHNFRFY